MNIVKLAVGINSISELRSKQEFKRKKYGNNNHITRLFPKKAYRNKKWWLNVLGDKWFYFCKTRN